MGYPDLWELISNGYKLMEHTIPALTPGGRQLGRIRLVDAQRHIREGVAVAKGNKQRLKGVVILDACGSTALPIGSLSTYYTEHLGGNMRVGTVKRLVNGQFRRWDPNLTFAELRAGRVVSEKTRA